MTFARVLTMAAGCLVLAGAAKARQADDPWAPTVVTVTAKYPGPVLWKAVSGDHVVWILGVPSITSPHAAWDSRRVEGLVSGAEAVYVPPTAAGGLGTALKYLSGKGLPGGRTLDGVAAPDDYRAFQALAGRVGLKTADYAHDKPAWAGLRFRTNVFQKMLLPVNAAEGKAIALAKAHAVPVRTIAHLRADAVIDALGGLSDAEGQACFGQLVADAAYTADRVDAMTAAWTAGDIAGYRRLFDDEPRVGCVDKAVDQAAIGDKGLNATVATIGEAMAGTRRSLVILPMRLLIGTADLKARLQAAGIMLQPPPGLDN